MAFLASALSVAVLMPRASRVPIRRLTTARMLSTPTTAPSRRKLLLSEASPEDWADVVSALEPFARGSRVQRLSDVLAKRRAGLHLVLENIADPFNGRSTHARALQPPHALTCNCAFYRCPNLRPHFCRMP